jgi:hypothetical protein
MTEHNRLTLVEIFCEGIYPHLNKNLTGWGLFRPDPFRLLAVGADCREGRDAHYSVGIPRPLIVGP